MAERLFYSMGEVAEMFDVNPSLLRHWETQFSVLRPKRNKKGNRLYSPADIEHLKRIYHLVKERGMTLEGARKVLRESRGRKEVPRDMELLERLQRVRAMLAEVKAELYAGEGELLETPDETADTEAAAIPTETAAEAAAAESEAPAEAADAAESDRTARAAGRRRKAVAKIEPAETAAAESEAQAEAADGAIAEYITDSESIAEASGSPEASGAATAQSGKRPGTRKPRRKKDESEHQELFAFYEQSLF